jgi:hypothetical protein
MEFYVYRYSAADLAATVQGSTGLTPLLVSALNVIEVSFLFPAALDPNDKTGLDQFMADAGYAFYRQAPQLAAFRASSKIVNDAVVVPTGAAWVTLGGVATNPGFFANNLTKIVGQITGNYKATGGTAELRVVETETATGIETVLGTFLLASSAGAWGMIEGLTNVAPKANLNTYRLEARGNTVTDLEVRFVTLVLLETP